MAVPRFSRNWAVRSEGAVHVGADWEGSDHDDANPQTTRIYLLGNFQIIDARGENCLPKRKKTKALLAYLCLSQGERHERLKLGTTFWNECSRAQVLDNVCHALSELSKLGGAWRLERSRHTVRLDAARCWIDALAIPDRPERLLEDLMGVSDDFDNWLRDERSRYETRWRSRLEAELGRLITEKAPPDERIGAARKLLAVVPTHGVAVCSLMTAFVEKDETAEAVREFERHLLLAKEADVPVSDRALALYEMIRRNVVVRLGQLPAAAKEVSDAPGQTDRLTSRDAGSVSKDELFEPALAVLPFRNLTGGKHQSHLVEGLNWDLSETLSRVPGLFVSAHASGATFQRQDRSPREIGTALGVRYLVFGHVRIMENRVRLSVELVEADTGKGLWRDHFDEKITALLELQNDLVEAVVRAVAPQLRTAELDRLRIKRPEDYTAYDYFLQAQESMHSASRMVFESARQLFDAAIERAPYYASALAWRAYWHVMRVGQGWSENPLADAQQAERFAARAIACNGREAMAFAIRGHAAAYLHKDFDQAFDCFETALTINRNSARAWLWNASAHAWTGNGAGAVEKITRAMALSPYDPLMCAYSGSASTAYLADRQYLRSADFGLRAIRDNRAYSAAYKTMIPALVLAGQEDEGRSQLQLLLRLEPDFTIDKFRQRFPGGDRDIGKLCCEAFAIAGAAK
jgi:TolB-like protein